MVTKIFAMLVPTQKNQNPILNSHDLTSLRYFIGTFFANI